MKRFIISIALMTASVAVFAQENTKAADAFGTAMSMTIEKQEEAFKSFADYFSKTASFAYANVSGKHVLLVSHETYGEDGSTEFQAIETSIFALDTEGKIMALGSIRSQGTLYPVSILDGKLMVAGHRFVKVYGIRGDVPELVLDSYEEGEGEKLDEMFATFEKGKPVMFRKKL